jgi:hypothetical protein
MNLGLNRRELLEACQAIGDMGKQTPLNADIFLNTLLIEGMKSAHSRVVRRLISEVPKNGYKVKFNAIELNSIYYVRNTLLIKSDEAAWDVALTRLLELNK